MTRILLDEASTESEAWDRALELGKFMLEYLFMSPDEWVILPPKKVTVTRGMTGKPWQIYAQKRGVRDGETDHAADGSAAA